MLCQDAGWLFTGRDGMLLSLHFFKNVLLFFFFFNVIFLALIFTVSAEVFQKEECCCDKFGTSLWLVYSKNTVGYFRQ